MANFYDENFIINLMLFNYRTMIASAPLLEFAIPKAQGALRDYYAKHLEEERGHDEMLRDDLRRMEVEDIPFRFDAAELAGSQYYLIAHHDAALLLGYMHAFESESLPMSAVDDLGKHYGVEFTSMRHHAKHDPLHRVELEQMIATLPDVLRSAVEWNESNVLRKISEALNG